MFQGSEPSKRLCEAEVDNFFAEIDALGIPDDAADIKVAEKLDDKLVEPCNSPPLPPHPPVPPQPPPENTSIEVNCRWSEYVDPQTQFVYYYNSITNETTWDMPEELARIKAKENESSSIPESANSTIYSKNGEKIEYLNEYVAHSDSSCSSDSSSNRRGRKVDEDKRKHKHRSKRKKSRETGEHNKKKQKVIEEVVESEDDNLIGPKLPTNRSKEKSCETEQLPENIKPADEGDDSETEEKESKRFIGPRLPSSDADELGKVDDVTNENLSEPVACGSTKFEEAQDELSLAIGEQSSVLLSKLQFLNVTKEALPLLSILLIKLETRYEDWTCGALSLERMASTLNDTMMEMANYESNAVPEGWKCFWDNSSSRYYYENQITKDCQWDYPNDSISSPKPVAKEFSVGNATDQDANEIYDNNDNEVTDDPSVSLTIEDQPTDQPEVIENKSQAEEKSECESEIETMSETFILDSLDEKMSLPDRSNEVEEEQIPVDTDAKENNKEMLLLEEFTEIETPPVKQNEETPSPMEHLDSPVTSPEATCEPPKVNTLRLVAYDDDDDSDSLSEDDISQGSTVNVKSVCTSDSYDVSLAPQPHDEIAAQKNTKVNGSNHSPPAEGDDMDLDSDDEVVANSVISVAPVPPPPPPPLPLLPARPITPPPPPPPPPLRSTLTAVPQPPQPPQMEFFAAAAPSSSVIFEPPPPPPPPPPPVPPSVQLSQQPVPDSSEEFDDDQGSSAASKRKKQKISKNKIGLKGMQNLFQKWQQVQENL